MPRSATARQTVSNASRTLSAKRRRSAELSVLPGIAITLLMAAGMGGIL